VCQGRNYRYSELLLESHHPPGDEWGEGADSGEPRRASGYDPPAGVHYPHDNDYHGYYDANHRHNYCHHGYYGYNHGYYGYNHGYYDANHRHNYCHRGHDGWANRDDHHRRYHIAGGYYSAEHDGGADQPIPVLRLPDGKRIG
jgi:hypothetical protein